nr:NADH dehydrogenase subunit 4 [Colpocephalum spinicollis]
MMLFYFTIVPCISIIFLCEMLVVEMALVNLFFNSEKGFFEWESLPNMMSLHLFADKLSFYLQIMTCWIYVCMVFTLDGYSGEFKSKSLLIISLLSLILIVMFSVMSTISFFTLFELSMIPTMILIVGWGYQPERIAAYFNFFYFTSIPSLPFLVFVILSLSPCWMLNTSYVEGLATVVFFLLLSLFLVKMPLYFVHFWLPKAHVEAPVSGSMILAGILLKMGGYGLIRLITLCKFSLSYFTICSISSLGMVLSCYMCLFSPDLKSIVAYSSVSHMNFMTLGILTLKKTAIMGSFIMMLSHALASSGMFYLCDVMYKRSSSRSLMLNKSYMIYSPLISFMWMVLCVLNMAFPLSPGSLSEILMGVSITMSFSFMLWSMMAIYFLFSAYYSVFIYYTVSHGSEKTPFLIWPMSMKEGLTMICHIIPSLMLILISFNFSL